jgi:hypothetical protein
LVPERYFYLGSFNGASEKEISLVDEHLLTGLAFLFEPSFAVHAASGVLTPTLSLTAVGLSTDPQPAEGSRS